MSINLGRFLNVLSHQHCRHHPALSPPDVSQHRHVSDFVPVAFPCSFCCAVSFRDCHLLNPRKMLKGRCHRSQEVQRQQLPAAPGRSGQFCGFSPSCLGAGQAVVGLQTLMALQHPRASPRPAGALAQAVSLPCSIFPYSAVPSVTDIQDHH